MTKTNLPETLDNPGDRCYNGYRNQEREDKIMKAYNLTPITCGKPADAKEWAVCNHYGIQRVAHDSKPYNEASDVDTGDKHISVKSAKFTLMAGSLCQGLTEFDDIWNLYESTTHSNLAAYVTADFKAYEMDMAEFKEFVYKFCRVERESAKNGGTCKIRCRTESKALLAWLEARA